MNNENIIRFTIDLDKNLHTNLKMLCAGRNKSMKEVVNSALERKIEEMKKDIYEKKY